MKLLLTSDWHARYFCPENRVESDSCFFDNVVLPKLGAVRDVAREHNVSAILQAGDMFDGPDPSRYVLSEILKIFMPADIPIYTVMGQHDCWYRQLNNIKRTGTYLLESAEVARIVGLDKNPEFIDDSSSKSDCWISGISFEQDYLPGPKITPHVDNFNILIAHASVGQRPLFPGHILTSEKQFINKHPGFDVILLGDIHQEFQYTFQSTQVFNTGPLIRKSIAEKDCEPNVIIYDTKTRKYERIVIPHKPWNEVFNITEEAQIADTKLQDFLNAIRAEKKQTVSFLDNLKEYYAKNEVSENAKNLIASFMEKAGMTQKELLEVL